ncbi:SRPBCC family protein [Pseudomonas aeruginosa]|nr:SRPBCC family protein [Pseudomonas aeruginosa]
MPEYPRHRSGVAQAPRSRRGAGQRPRADHQRPAVHRTADRLLEPVVPGSAQAVHRRQVRTPGGTLRQARAEDIAHTNKSLFIFPNLVINDILGLNIRSFFPTAADEVSVTVWGAGFADETREERAARINGLISFIGPGGFGTPDDVEILESCQRAYAHAALGYSDFSRGMGPATRRHVDEEQNRGFWREWSRRLGQQPAALRRLAVAVWGRLQPSLPADPCAPPWLRGE